MATQSNNANGKKSFTMGAVGPKNGTTRGGQRRRLRAKKGATSARPPTGVSGANDENPTKTSQQIKLETTTNANNKNRTRPQTPFVFGKRTRNGNTVPVANANGQGRNARNNRNANASNDGSQSNNGFPTESEIEFLREHLPRQPAQNRTNQWVQNHAETIHVPLSNANSSFRSQSAAAAAQAGFSPDVVRGVHALDLEREQVRQEMMRDEAGNNTINRMRGQEHRVLIDSYLDQVDRYIREKNADGVTKTIRKYQDDRRALFRRHRAMNMEYSQRRKFEDLVMQGNTNGIRAFIKNDKRRSAINKISPNISALINEGKHDEALKMWEKQMKSLENESNTKSFAKRAKDAVKNGKGFGSAFKVKFRMPSFEKPEGQWVKRRH